MTGSEALDQTAELELVRRIVSGERDLFRAVVERHEATVYAMIRRQLSDDETVRDLTQETFLRAYRGLIQFRGGSALGTWIVRIALNVTAGYFESRAFKEFAKTAQLEEPPTEIAAEPAQVEPYSEAERTQLKIAIASLKPIYREVVVLCGLEGKSYQEAADVLSIPFGTVCSRLNTAHHQLRLSLRRTKK